MLVFAGFFWIVRPQKPPGGRVASRVDPSASARRRFNSAFFVFFWSLHAFQVVIRRKKRFQFVFLSLCLCLNVSGRVGNRTLVRGTVTRRDDICRKDKNKLNVGTCSYFVLPKKRVAVPAGLIRSMHLDASSIVLTRQRSVVPTLRS